MPPLSRRQVLEERIDTAFNAIVRVHRSAEALDDIQLMDDCSQILRWLADTEKHSIMKALGQAAPPTQALSSYHVPF